MIGARETRRRCLARTSAGVTFSTSALVSSVAVSALHLRAFSQGPCVSSKTVCSHLSLLISLICRVTASTCRTAEGARLPGSGSSRKRRNLLATKWSIFLLFLSGAMAPSAVSSALYVETEDGNHAETSPGANIYNGDAASFHDWEFRTRLRIAGKTGDQYIEAMPKVCEGLRGDAFAAAQGGCRRWVWVWGGSKPLIPPPPPQNSNPPFLGGK